MRDAATVVLRSAAMWKASDSGLLGRGVCAIWIKNTLLGLGWDLRWILALSFNSCVMWDLLINLSECQLRASLVAQLVKNPPAMQECLVRFLGQTRNI